MTSLLEVKDLVIKFALRSGEVTATNGVSFTLEKGERLGLVGESGCGKTTAGHALLRLHEPTSGEVYYNGQNLVGLKEKEMKAAGLKVPN